MLVNLNTMLNYFIYIFCLFSVLFAQEQIGQGLFHGDLINYLQKKTIASISYNKTITTLSYKSNSNPYLQRITTLSYKKH